MNLFCTIINTITILAVPVALYGCWVLITTIAAAIGVTL